MALPVALQWIWPPSQNRSVLKYANRQISGITGNVFVRMVSLWGISGFISKINLYATINQFDLYIFYSLQATFRIV